MRKGDLVMHWAGARGHGHAKLWLYSEIPKPGVPTISIATSWPWVGGMHGIVLGSGWGSYNRYLQVLTSLGHVGWIPIAWAMKVGAK